MNVNFYGNFVNGCTPIRLSITVFTCYEDGGCLTLSSIFVYGFCSKRYSRHGKQTSSHTERHTRILVVGSSSEHDVGNGVAKETGNAMSVDGYGFERTVTTVAGGTDGKTGVRR